MSFGCLHLQSRLHKISQFSSTSYHRYSVNILLSRGYFYHHTEHRSQLLQKTQFSHINAYKIIKCDLSTASTVGVATLPDLTTVWPFHFWPSHIVSTFLDVVQQSSHLPWWAVILISGVVIKSITLLPCHIYFLKSTQNAVKTSPKQLFSFATTYFNNLITKGEKHALKMANHERRFILHTASPMILLMHGHIAYAPLLWLFVPTATILVGLNYLNSLPYIPMLTGGILSFTNLTVTDPVLPIVTAVCFALYVKRHPLFWTLPLPPIKASPILIVPLLCTIFAFSHLPASILIYFIGSNLTGCVLSRVLRIESVKRNLNLWEHHEVFDRIVPKHVLFQELANSMERNKQLLLQRERTKNKMLSGSPQSVIDEVRANSIESIGLKQLEDPVVAKVPDVGRYNLSKNADEVTISRSRNSAKSQD